MRLGDVDKLLYHKRKVMFFGLVPDDECWGFAVPVEEIDKAPTIDAVPVVRCKNCKHFNLQTHECENESLSTDHEGGASYSLNFYDDDFCSYGEWREADHEVSEL